MGTFYTRCVVENHIDRQRRTEVRVLVDTGSENTWIAERTLRSLGVALQKSATV